MIVIKPTQEEQHTLKLIPRTKCNNDLDVRIINELSSEETNIQGVSGIFVNGFLFITIPYIFNIDDSYFSLDLYNDNQYIYRGKIWVINEEDLQNYEEEEYITI